MATILNFFVSRYLEKLADFVEGEVCQVLGVKTDVEKLQRRLKRIQGVLEDAERRRQKEVAVDNWVRELKDVMYDADDIIDLCMYRGGKLLEAHPSSCSIRYLSSSIKCIKYRHEIASRIKALNDRLKEITDDNSIVHKLQNTEQAPQVSSRQTSPLHITSDIVGAEIEDATNSLISSILKNEQDKCQLFGIFGMGGIGKTTLAQKIFNDERIKGNFKICIWLYVSKNYSETELLKEIIRGLGGNDDGAKSRAELETKLVTLISNNVFLVLDDVWTAKVWWRLLRTPMLRGIATSKILITTRNERVAIDMDASSIHHVEKMDPLTGWKLLCKIVFKEGEEDKMIELKEVGSQIVEKCDRLPLAITVIGGVLRSKEKNVLEWTKVLKSDMWQMKQIDEELPGALNLSYEDLPSHLKSCFLYLAVFRRSSYYYQDLIRLWMAEGFIIQQGGLLIEEIGEDYYKELIWRNLLQSDPLVLDGSRCTVHDLLRALCENLIGDEGLSVKCGQPLKMNSFTKIRRLSVSNAGDTLTLPNEIMKQKCLRTLFLLDSPDTKKIEYGLFETLRHLRVLLLCDTQIESLPDFIGKLLHIRYLDLDRTNIREIPESIGHLANMQTLCAAGCKSLRRLPEALTKLCNLRCLNVEGSPLSFVPNGIGRLTNLYTLQGYVVGHHDEDSSASNSVAGCGLEELKSLHQLRTLTIDSLKRAEPGTCSVLANKYNLRELRLVWTGPVNEGYIQRAEMICNIDLSPPSTLKIFVIVGFPGRILPSWMMPTSICSSFQVLESLSIRGIRSCTELPPLGMLASLKWLYVEGAKAIKAIGPEFLGVGFPATPAFPQLTYMLFEDMPSLEKWLMESMKEGVYDGARGITLLPNLKEFYLTSCPKLTVLPERLHHATRLIDLFLEDNANLETISNLPSLSFLEIENCPNLKRVENLDALQHIILKCPPQTEHLPQWVSCLFERHQTALAGPWHFRKLEMYCGLPLLKSCLKDEVNWHIIQQIPEVRIQTTDNTKFITYTKDPLVYDTNADSKNKKLRLL